MSCKLHNELSYLKYEPLYPPTPSIWVAKNHLGESVRDQSEESIAQASFNFKKRNLHQLFLIQFCTYFGVQLYN